ncbi:MAG: hypothetical protein ISR45_04400 [Rhodospirillales bacterium]|nr:hypothetical protein [Rhodospirillales bacterium]
MNKSLTPDLENLSRVDLEVMREAGLQILECYRVLQKSADNIVGEVLRGNEPFIELDHYPPGDIFDPESNCQYYYHAHRAGEHGHFHTFLRQKGMAATMQPIAQTRMDYMDERDDTICHLIAISMDNAGYPRTLFTTNRWVTAENWYSADDTIAMLDSFEIDLVPPSWPVNIWLTAMLRLFRPQIIKLVRQRDGAVERWLTNRPDEDVFEDRGLEITSEMAISVEDQIIAVNRALKLH